MSLQFLGGAAMASCFDADIDNLDLSEFEKNGLQVYRNHTKSLTEQPPQRICCLHKYEAV
jgi:hypothetical protein